MTGDKHEVCGVSLERDEDKVRFEAKRGKIVNEASREKVSQMIRAACHCGAVRFEIADPPEWVLDCNCTICWRYGGLWTYFHGPEGQAKLLKTPDPATTEAYTWLDGDIAFHRCKTCGCVTHSVAAKADPPVIFTVNCRMMAGLDPAKVRIRRVDNSHSGFFWTRPDEPVITSRHPTMPPPTFDDWR